MNMKRLILLNMLVPVVVLMFFGCVWIGSFGKIRLHYGDYQPVTIEQLQENWRDYSIAYAGGNKEYPSAILFDPANDSRKIVYDKWTAVEDKQTLSDLIGWLALQEDYGPYGPKLYMVLGPDNQLYGYIFTAWDHVLLKRADEKSLWIEDLPHPPFRIKPGTGSGNGGR